MKKLFVCALAVAMVFAFTAPTMAADWNFYGNVQFQTFSKDVDTRVPGADSDTDTVWNMEPISRFGGKVVSGDISANYEVKAYGHDFVEGSASNDEVKLRHLYGEWNFGAGKLLIGQTWNLVSSLISGQQADSTGMNGYGALFHDRTTQIRLTFGGLKIAFVTPNTQNTALAGGDIDVTLPRMEFAYKFATDMFWVEPFLGYQTYDVQYSAASNSTTDVTSVIYGVQGKVNFGPAWVGLCFAAGTNPGDYELYGASASIINGGRAFLEGTEMKDVDYMEYMLNAGFKFSDMISMEAGYGRQTTEATVAGIGKVEDPRFSYYINVPITLAPGVMLIPEYSMFSEDDVTAAGVSADETETTYIGAKWMISF
jgi:hypothetical protein